jgi:hypothetical protein
MSGRYKENIRLLDAAVTGAAEWGLLEIITPSHGICFKPSALNFFPLKMHGDVGVEVEGNDVTLDQLFDCPGRHRLGAKAIPAIAAYRFLRAEEVGGGISPDAGKGR